MAKKKPPELVITGSTFERGDGNNPDLPDLPAGYLLTVTTTEQEFILKFQNKEALTALIRDLEKMKKRISDLDEIINFQPKE
jgi:hypothetical protein